MSVETRHVKLIIIMCTIFYEIYAGKNHDFGLTKLVKRQNEDLRLLDCSLSKNHEEFNSNITITWWFKQKTCSLCRLNSQKTVDDEWKLVECDGPCRMTLTLKLDNYATNGFYMCKMFPYFINSQTMLEIEITKTFHLGIVDNAPELLFNDTQSQIEVPIHSSLVLQCKCRSSKQKPTIKWFKQKTLSDDDDESPLNSYMESPRAIKYFENFYQPLTSSGIKELEDGIFLSKIIISNVSDVSTFVCVALNMYGYSYREFSITIQRNIINSINNANDDDDDYGENIEINNLTQVNKSFELFLIPILLFLIVIIQVSSILYLLIYRSIMKEANKNMV